MAVIREFLVELGLDADSDELERVDAAVSNLRDGLSSLAKIGGVALGAVTSLGAGIFELTRRTANAGVEVDNLAQSAGVSAQQMQEMSFVANALGRDSERLQDAFKELQIRARDAAMGTGPAAEAFEQLGIQTQNANGELRSSTDIFEQVQDSLSGLESQSRRVALADALMGEAGTQLLPIFGEQADEADRARQIYQELGATLDESAIRQSRRFDANLQLLQASFSAMRNAIGQRFLPVFNEILPVLTQFGAESADVIGQNIDAFFESVADSLADFNDWLEKIDFQGISIKQIVSQFQTWIERAGQVATIITGWKVFSAITQVTAGVATLLSNVSGLIGMFSAAGTAGAASGTATTVAWSPVIGTVGLVGGAIAGLIAIGWVFWDEIKQIGTQVMNLFAVLANLVLETFGTSISDMTDSMVTWFFDALDMIGEAFTLYIESWKEEIQQWIDALRGAVNWLGQFTDAADTTLEQSREESINQQTQQRTIFGESAPQPQRNVSQSVGLGDTVIQLQSTGDPQRDNEMARNTARNQRNSEVEQASSLLNTGVR